MSMLGFKKNKIHPESLHKLKKGASDDYERALKLDDPIFTIQNHDSGKDQSLPIVKPYNSSKVCFDLNPRYADETCGPTNARHKMDGASFINPKLWYEETFFTANEIRACKLVQKDPNVRTYVECAYSYVNEEFDKQSAIYTIRYNNILRGLNNGYRGLETFYYPRSVWIEEASYARAKVVKFAKKAKYGKTKSNDIDLCIYSEKITYWDRVVAYRMAQVDAIAASK